MSITFNSVAVDSFKHLIDGAKRIVLTCHMSPDGDALGSSLALAQVLRAMGKGVRVITPDEPPRNLRVLPGARKVMAWSSFGAVAERNVMMADLIICLDFNALYRLSRLEPIVRSSKAPKVLIDHHKSERILPTCCSHIQACHQQVSCCICCYVRMHLDNFDLALTLRRAY